MILKITSTKKQNIVLLITSVTILFFVFRISIPTFKYPFIVFYAYLIFFSLTKLRSGFAVRIFHFVKNYYLIIINSLFFIVFTFISNKLYNSAVKDSLNIIILLSIFFMAELIMSSKKEADYFLNNTINLILIFSILISIIKLVFLINIFSINSYSHFNKVPGTVLFFKNIDNNFGTLPLLFGTILIIYQFSKPLILKKKVYLTVFLLLLTLNIFLSASKRSAYFFLFFFTIIIILVSLSIVVKNKSLYVNLRKNLSLFFICILLVLVILFPFFLCTNYTFKSNSIKLLGCKNTERFMYDFSTILFRYFPFLNNNSLVDLNNSLWYRYFDSRNPETWGGLNTHKIIYPLVGTNVEIVPSNSKGYFIDKSSEALPANNGNTYSITTIRTFDFKKGENFQASVYCYVSKDFNGSWVSIQADGAVKGGFSNSYDLSNAGKWQKLSINVSCEDGRTELNLYFSLPYTRDFSSLKGYVIFAHPEYKIIKSDSSDSDYIPFKSNNSFFQYTHYKQKIDQGNEILENNQFASFSPPIFIFTIVINNFDKDIDPIRKWVNKMISEDTTYVPYKTPLKTNFSETDFGEDRLSRWKFAIEIWYKEYNWRQKIFGGGFNFLSWYGYVFKKDKTETDYPHNPFLHILLYSGILGVLLYIILLFKVISIYWSYRKKYFLFYIFFIVTFYFTFFSGGNPLDPPIMGFFVILPFLIHSVHKTSEKKIKYQENIIDVF